MADTTTSTVSSVGSSLITALGGGSGTDMGKLASDLSVAQYALRTNRLNTKSETLDSQISEASTLKSMLLNFSTSLGDRVRTGDLSPQPQVANSSVASAAYSGVGTPSGSYSLEVEALAKSQTWSSTASAFGASTDTVGSGTLTLRFGTVSGSTFTADANHAAVDITIAAGASLSDVATAINSAGAGVTAYVANTTSGAQLVLKGQEGAANGFILEATPDSADTNPGLSRLAWEPTTGASSQLLAGAGDASFKLDGLQMKSSSNRVNDVVPSVNLTLTGTNIGSPTKITFGDPSSALTTVMQDLTSALNEIMAELNTATDPKTGDLARDSGARTLKSTLSSLTSKIVMPNAAPGAPSTLADLGLKIERDGTFSFDSARLSETLKADASGAAAMFTNGLYGVYSTIDGITRKATSSTDPGSLGGSITRYTDLQTKVATDLAKVAEQQEALRTRLVSQFTASEKSISVSNSTLSFLQNQIDVWNAQNN